MAALSSDHDDRMERVRIAIDGLSVGDAFGSQFFVPSNRHLLFGPKYETPPGSWPYTDDAEMALGIAEVLASRGYIDQDELARVFAVRYQLNMYRGYGPGQHRILAGIGQGQPWQAASRQAFSGSGSFGNGSAMRVAPVGAYFADDLERVASEARKSAEVTHAHLEGLAGSVAIAIATATAWNLRDQNGEADEEERRLQFFSEILAHTPDGVTRQGILRAAAMEPILALDTAASLLGNGSQITCMDTVPFCLWVAARHSVNYPEALWDCVRAGGDLDTTAAIVGGIVVMGTGRDGIPPEWLANREPLNFTAAS